MTMILILVEKQHLMVIYSEIYILTRRNQQMRSCSEKNTKK